LVARGYVLRADKQPEIIISSLLFFGSFAFGELAEVYLAI
jgi:hypothetical protein